nr:MAG TPA: hypothetical protein [Caudoviricetes sp.]
MKKLSGKKYMEVYTTYIGRYVTKIFVSDKGDVYQNDGNELDLEGKMKLLQLKSQGYILED